MVVTVQDDDALESGAVNQRRSQYASRAAAVNEVVLNFGEQGRLLGIVSLPDRLEPDSTAVLLPNTGLEHRVGPNRLHVYLSRALADAGFVTLRLDLAGMGDSGAFDGGDPSRDLSAAMDALQARGFGSRFAALGLCSGAHDAHRAIRADHRLVAGAFIDGYLFPTLRFYMTYVLQRASDPARVLRKLSKSLGISSRTITPNARRSISISSGSPRRKRCSGTLRPS